MTTLFQLYPQAYSGIKKGQGLSIEGQFVWQDAEKYHIQGIFGEADIQKATGFNNGIQLFLLSYRMVAAYRLVLKAFSPSILTLLQLKGQSAFSLGIKESFRLVPSQYHILSLPVKKTMLDITENSEGKILLITLRPDYFSDMVLFYPRAKCFSKERRTVLAYPGKAEALLLDRQMRGVLRFILDHLQNAPKADPFTLGLAVKTLISLALTREQENAGRHRSNEYAQIAEIMRLLQENPDEFPGIKKLSKMALMNMTTFKKLFVQETGMPPEQFWNRNRLHIAYELLSTQHKRPSEVAMQLGYSSLHAFDKAFKKYFGVTPSMIQ